MMADQILESSSVEALMSMKAASFTADNLTGSPNRPQRTRRRNRFVYNDDEVTPDVPSRPPKKYLKQILPHLPASPPTPNRHKTPETTVAVPVANPVNVEKAVAKRVGGRLRNLLKLPKAHKMCMFEWFYSHLDSALFNGDNDFCLCLKESFPELKTRKLTRAHWSKIRRLMGKPRRCSAAFFEEERAALSQKRMKIRLLQQRKIAHEDPEVWSDLPRELPMSLVVGTNVTARLRGAHDGLFTGQIDAVNLNNASYRVTFDRSNLGTHSIPDIEVASCEPQETINLMSLMDRKRHVPSNRILTGFSNHDHESAFLSPRSVNEHDPVLGRSPIRSKLLGSNNAEDGGTLGGFPVQLLKRVARLSCVLAAKKEKIQRLGEMNSLAEKASSYGEPLALEFQRKYATVVLELEKLNKDLNALLVGVQRYCLELYPEQTLPSDRSSQLRRKCLEEAETMVAAKNVGDDDVTIGSKRAVRDDGLTDLITQLTSLMLQVKELKGNKGNCIEFKSLNDVMKEIKSKLCSENMECFQNNVEIHIAHVRSGMEHNFLSGFEVSSNISEC